MKDPCTVLVFKDNFTTHWCKVTIQKTLLSEESQSLFCMGMMDKYLLPAQLHCMTSLKKENLRRKGWGTLKLM